MALIFINFHKNLSVFAKMSRWLSAVLFLGLLKAMLKMLSREATMVGLVPSLGLLGEFCLYYPYPYCYICFWVCLVVVGKGFWG